MTSQIKLLLKLAARIRQLPIAPSFQTLSGAVQLPMQIKHLPRICALVKLHRAAQNHTFFKEEHGHQLDKLIMQQLSYSRVILAPTRLESIVDFQLSG